MILLQKNWIIRVLTFWTQSKEEAYRLGCLIKIEIKENFIVTCKDKRFKHRLFPLSLTKCYFATQEICWAQKEDNHEIWLSSRCIFKIQAGTGSLLSWWQQPDENIIFSKLKIPSKILSCSFIYFTVLLLIILSYISQFYWLCLGHHFIIERTLINGRKFEKS